MNNEQNDLVRYAIEKIKRDQRFKPDCCFIIPTGPTGPGTGATGPTGPTGAYNYFFNKIHRNYSSSKKYTRHKTVVYILISLNNFYFIINL